MPSPRRITWWRLQPEHIARFRKPERGLRVRDIHAVSWPPQVHLPEFELVEDYGLSANPGPTLYTQVYDRLDALVSAAIYEFRSHVSQLYGVIRSADYYNIDEHGSRTVGLYA